MNLLELKKASNILLYGYGVEGQSTAKFLSANSISFEIHDQNREEFKGPKNVKDYDVIIVSAGINREKLPFAKKKMTSQTEIFFHSLTIEERKKVIGITGTKGKSTTAQLTHDMLKRAGKKVALAGNIGVAMLDLLPKLKDLDFLVLELSSFQLAHLDIPAHMVICTNLLDDHIDWHGSKKAYHQAKANLWKYQDGNDLLLIPDYQKKLFPQRATPCLPIGVKDLPEDSIWRSEHARQNFGMVAELADRLEISDAFIEALQNLKSLPHRQETVGIFKNILFIDNAIASNPHGTLADVAFWKEDIGTLLIGGKDRGQDFAPLFEYIQKQKLPLQVIILESEVADRIEQELMATAPNTLYWMSKDMKEAVKIGYHATPKGKICLLSPASASWDRYKSYAEKGDDFAACVKDQA